MHVRGVKNIVQGHQMNHIIML